MQATPVTRSRDRFPEKKCGNGTKHWGSGLANGVRGAEEGELWGGVYGHLQYTGEVSGDGAL